MYVLYNFGVILLLAFKRPKLAAIKPSLTFPPITLFTLWLLFVHDWLNQLYFKKSYAFGAVPLEPVFGAVPLEPVFGAVPQLSHQDK